MNDITAGAPAGVPSGRWFIALVFEGRWDGVKFRFAKTTLTTLRSRRGAPANITWRVCFIIIHNLQAVLLYIIHSVAKINTGYLLRGIGTTRHWTAGASRTFEAGVRTFDLSLYRVHPENRKATAILKRLSNVRFSNVYKKKVYLFYTLYQGSSAWCIGDSRESCVQRSIIIGVLSARVQITRFREWCVFRILSSAVVWKSSRCIYIHVVVTVQLTFF